MKLGRTSFAPFLVALLPLLAAPSSRAADEDALPVVVCDSHHHVLRHWLAAARAGRLPQHGVSVVHFDAHPDLTVPKVPLPEASPADPARLTAMLDISSFQLAAAWIGLVRRVVWLRPDWAEQLPDGRRDFRLGRVADGRLRVDDPADYWVLDGAWRPTSQLLDPLDVTVLVLPLSRAQGIPLHEGPAILDVDLDGFATRNPAVDQLRAAGFQDADLARLRTAFARERLELPDDPEARIAALAEILASLEAATGDDAVEALAGAWRLWRRGVAAADLWFTWRLLSSETSGIATDVLLESGRDLVGLPEHAADAGEIRETTRALADLLRSGALRPSLVTVARSARDGFTPARAWPAIERAFLSELAAAGVPLAIRYDPGLAPVPGSPRAPH